MTTVPRRSGGARTGDATATTVRFLGGLVALTGVEHGLGEISQGSVPPPAMVFRSWPHLTALDPLSGEPAMSVIPNLLISGIVTVLTALVLGVVALNHPDRRHRGPVLLALSVLLLLVGGGFGPPLLGTLTALLATRVHALPAHRPGTATRLGARLWPWPLLVAVTCFLGLVPGTALLYAASGRDISTLVVVLTLAAFTSTALAMWTARARDRVRGVGEPTPLDSGHPGHERRTRARNTS